MEFLDHLLFSDLTVKLLMSTRKPAANPLLASGGQFSLADSFGVTATLPVVAPAEEDSFLGDHTHHVL